MNFLALFNIALRLFLFETLWNNKGQQNLGRALAIEPALKKIYRNDYDKFLIARKESLEFFNTNPIFSGFLIGVLIKAEEEKSKGRFLENAYLINTYSNSLAALGDSFFWQTLLPFCSIVVFWTQIAFENYNFIWLLPILFTLIAVPIRFIGLYFGYYEGLKSLIILNRLKIFYLATFLKKINALILGATVIIFVDGLEVLNIKSTYIIWVLFALLFFILPILKTTLCNNHFKTNVIYLVLYGSFAILAFLYIN